MNSIKGICFIFIAVLIAYNSLDAFVDLEENIQDFVIETKKIEIPGYPDAFNPSVIKWRGAYLLSFRYRDPLTGSTDPIGFVWMDEDFNITGQPHTLQKFFEEFSPPSRAQDPRLVAVNNTLYIIYNNFVNSDKGEVRRMIVAKLHIVGNDFYITHPQVLKNFEGSETDIKGKNWVPFAYENKLLLSYSINPHKVFSPNLGISDDCTAIAETSAETHWKWGVLRGGTPALSEGDSYLAFFHTCKTMKTLQSDGIQMPHYFMGAYLFDSTPPFSLKALSREPIVGKNFYNGPAYQTWTPLRVVFPGGYISNEKYIWVAYGRQDHELWIVKLDKQGLLNSLVPVQR